MPTPTAYFTDGTTTVTLTATDAMLLEFVPTTPSLRVELSARSGVDGAVLDALNFDEVEERARVAFNSASVSTIRASINSLNKLFDLARRYAEQRVALGVYFVFKPDTGDALYRSQVLGGRVVLDESTLSYPYANALIEAEIVFTRRYYWEADSESEVATTLTASGAGTTGVKTIRDHNDSGHQNWVEIPASGISGDMPAPCRIELTHNGSAVYYTDFVVSHEVVLPSVVTATYEGESASGVSSRSDGITPLSEGNYGRATWAGTSATDIATWALSAADLTAANGRWLKCIMRLGNLCAYSDLYLSLSVRHGTINLFTSERVLLSASKEYQALPSIPLPPSLVGLGSLVPLSLVLVAQRATAGSHTLDVDFIQLLPTDGLRVLSALSLGVTQNGVLKDDGMSAQVYQTFSASNYPTHYGEGTITLVPSARRQRLRVLWTRTGAAMNIDDTLGVQVYYRPRRLTL